MPTVEFYPRYAEQEGWCDSGGSPTPFQTNYFGGMSIETFRHFIFRFTDIDLPAGATITAANIIYIIYVKNHGDPNSFTYNHYYEPDVASGTVLRQDALPLRPGVYEENTANRNWTQHVSGATFNWNTTLGPADQGWAVDVTSLVQTAYSTNTGRHMSFAFKMQPTAEVGDLAFSTNARGGLPTYLRIEYTGGTARNEVVNINENANFVLTDAPHSTGAPTFWVNNQVFGTYQANPTYSTASSHSGIPAAPQGGNILKITSTEDTKRAVSWYISPNHLERGTWYCFSVFAYVPTGVSDVRITSLQTVFSGNLNRMSTKDTWVRMYIPVLISPDQDPFLGVGSVDGMANGTSFYLANANFTKGNHLYPYFDGNSTDSATYHRTFEWGGGTTGKRNGGISYVSLDNNPTVTGVSPQPSQSTHKSIATVWNYSDPYGESQSRYRVEIRKKRP